MTWLRQYDEAVDLLTGESSPLDLVKVLNNRSLVHLEAGHFRLARADLRRCGQVAAQAELVSAGSPGRRRGCGSPGRGGRSYAGLRPGSG